MTYVNDNWLSTVFQQKQYQCEAPTGASSKSCASQPYTRMQLRKSCNVWQKIRCHKQPRGLSSLHLLLMEFGTSRGAMTRVRTIWWKGRIPLGWGVQTVWTSRKSKDPFKQSLSSRCTPLPALPAYTLLSGCGEKTTAISWNTALQNHVNGWCEERFWTTL